MNLLSSLLNRSSNVIVLLKGHAWIFGLYQEIICNAMSIINNMIKPKND
jgi:uncharacterized protein YsxB (DUF464 family)